MSLAVAFFLRQIKTEACPALACRNCWEDSHGKQAGARQFAARQSLKIQTNPWNSFLLSCRDYGRAVAKPTDGLRARAVLKRTTQEIFPKSSGAQRRD